MRKFWGFYDNGKYRVGCNGASMYLFDAQGREMAKFRDIPYGYEGAFTPGTNIFLLRSTEGRIAVYDCDERKLLRKFRFSGIDCAQDDGFCFSPDGAYFLNVEKCEPWPHTRLSIYETESFSPVKRLFEDNASLSLDDIEYNAEEDLYNVLFYVRDARGIYDQGYLGELKEDKIVNAQPLGLKAYSFLRDYKSLQQMNFAEKAMEWSGLHYSGYSNEEMLQLRSRDFNIATFPKIAGEIMK